MTSQPVEFSSIATSRHNSTMFSVAFLDGNSRNLPLSWVGQHNDGFDDITAFQDSTAVNSSIHDCRLPGPSSSLCMNIGSTSLPSAFPLVTPHLDLTTFLLSHYHQAPTRLSNGYRHSFASDKPVAWKLSELKRGTLVIMMMFITAEKLHFS